MDSVAAINTLVRDRLKADRTLTRFIVASGAYFLLYSVGLMIRPSVLYLRLQSDFLYLVAPFASLLLVLNAIRTVSGHERIGWISLGVLIGSWLVADASFSYFDLVRGTEPPFPGLTDAFYYLGYLGLIGGVALTTFPRGMIKDGRWVLDALTVSLVAVVLAVVYVIKPVLASSTFSPFGTAVLLGYPVLDLVALVLLVSALFAMGTQPRKRTLVLMAAALTLIGTDTGYFYLVSVAGYNNVGNPLDLGYIAAYILLGWSTLVPDEHRANVRHLQYGVLTTALPATAAILMLVVLGWTGIAGSTSPLIAGFTCGTVGLVLIRQMTSLRRHEERLVALTRQTGEVISIVDAEAIVLFQTPSIQTVLGFTQSEILGSKLSRLIHWEDRPLFRVFLDKVIAEPGVRLTLETRVVSKGGGVRDFELTATDQSWDPAVAGILLVGRDITQQRQLQAELVDQASRDTLTGLLNPASFLARVNERLALPSGELQPYVLYIDLDNFKAINDGLGHSTGDLVIREIADRLLLFFNSSDLVARLGGDEFAVLTNAKTDHNAVDLANGILRAIAEPISIDARALHIRASIGVARSAPDTNGKALIDCADVAMYSAKRKGRHRVEVFEPEMLKAASLRLRLIGDLRDAVTNSELELHYQPVRDLASARLLGVEALARWHHPELGLISPQEFIPLAEASGLIREIGRWVLTEACSEANRLFDLSHEPDRRLVMAVNVSTQELLDPGFVAEVSSTLAASGLAPQRLVLEVTESSLMEDVARCTEALIAVHSLGVQLALDDFGTGYSSLSQLRSLPFDILKIDRAFIESMDGTGSGENLTRAIVNMGRTLSLQVIAEGIEQPSQYERLRAMGCEAGQGFLFSPPLTQAEIEDLVAGEGRAAA